MTDLDSVSQTFHLQYQVYLQWAPSKSEYNDFLEDRDYYCPAFRPRYVRSFVSRLLAIYVKLPFQISPVECEDHWKRGRGNTHRRKECTSSDHQGRFWCLARSMLLFEISTVSILISVFLVNLHSRKWILQTMLYCLACHASMTPLSHHRSASIISPLTTRLVPAFSCGDFDPIVYDNLSHLPSWVWWILAVRILAMFW